MTYVLYFISFLFFLSGFSMYGEDMPVLSKILASLISFAIAYVLFKKAKEKSKNKKEEKLQEMKLESEQQQLTQQFLFYARGCVHYQDEIEYVIKQAQKLRKKNKDIRIEKYPNISDKIYDIKVKASSLIQLKLEPDNPYDSNAIALINDKGEVLGYVPAKVTTRVKNIMEGGSYIINWESMGGYYQSHSEFEKGDRFAEHHHEPYGLKIRLKY